MQRIRNIILEQASVMIPTDGKVIGGARYIPHCNFDFTGEKLDRYQNPETLQLLQQPKTRPDDTFKMLGRCRTLLRQQSAQMEPVTL